MANTSPRSSSVSVNRASLRSANGASTAARLVTSRLPQKPPESDFVYFLKAVFWMSGGLLSLIAVYAMGWLMHDSMATGNALAEARKERSTLVCQAGHMSHGDGSLHDKVFGESYFVCTDWKTLQAIEMEEKPPKDMGATKPYQ